MGEDGSECCTNCLATAFVMLEKIIRLGPDCASAADQPDLASFAFPCVAIVRVVVDSSLHVQILPAACLHCCHDKAPA